LYIAFRYVMPSATTWGQDGSIMYCSHVFSLEPVQLRSAFLHHNLSAISAVMIEMYKSVFQPKKTCLSTKTLHHGLDLDVLLWKESQLGRVKTKSTDRTAEAIQGHVRRNLWGEMVVHLDVRNWCDAVTRSRKTYPLTAYLHCSSRWKIFFKGRLRTISPM